MIKIKKLCILSDFYEPNGRGGAEICCKFIADGLSLRGFDVHVITPNLDVDGYEEEYGINQTIHRYSSTLRRMILERGKGTADKLHQSSAGKEAKSELDNMESPIFNFIHFFYRKYSAWDLARAFKKIHKKEKFDIILANNVEPIMALNHIRNIPMVGYIRDFHLFKKKINKNIKYLAINEKARDLGIKYGLKDITVINDPVLNDKISLLTKEEARKKLNMPYKNICLFVGHFSPRSDPTIIKEIAKNNPDIDFVLDGSGPISMESDLKNIHLMGRVNNIADYYKSADLLLYLHDPEWGLGMVPLEAMANGTPVVSYKFEESKFPLFMMDKEQMSNGIKNLFKHRHHLETMGKECLKIIENYKEEKILDDLEAFFKKVKE